jgi:hypothetical protein
VHLRSSVDDIDRPVEINGTDGTRVLVYGIPYLEPEVVRARLEAEKSHAAVLTAAMDRIRADIARVLRGDALPSSGKLVAFDALTDHDPVNMASQDGSGSATIIGEARAAMLASLGLDTVAVSSGGSGAVRFRKQPAIAFDYATRRLPPTLAPTASVNQGTTDTDESVPRTCVFPPAFDPAFAGLPTQGSATCGTPRVDNDRPDDRLRACGNVLCSSIPIYYARNGRFNCRYAADAVIDVKAPNQKKN